MSVDRTALMRQVVRYQSSREFDKANTAIALLMEHFPTDPDVNHLYAGLLKSSRQFVPAIRHYKQALAAKPKDANCWNDLGAAYVANNQTADAIGSFEKALKFSPDFPEALLNLGASLHKIHEHARAIDCVTRGLGKRPNVPAAHLLLGNVYKSAARLDDAIGSYKRAIALNPKFHQAHYNLALALRDSEQLTEALRHCTEALSLKPDHYGSLILSGQINEHLGEIEAAKVFYSQCMAISPESTEAYWNFANLGEEPFSASVIESMQAISHQGMTGESRVFLLFALAKAMEQQRDYSSSFEYLQLANRLKCQLLGDDVVDPGQLMDCLRNAFDADLVARLRNKGNAQVAPIFIVGMVRSGTSLIEQILASHSEIAGGGELETSLQLLFDELPSLTGQDWQTSVAAMDTGQLQHLASRYCDINRTLVSMKPYFTDKLPFNFALIGFLSSLFPKAKFVHVYKHPLDSCLSCYKQLFTVGQEFSYALDDLADYYQQYLSTMRHWSSLLPDKIFHVSYAALVGSPRTTIEQLLTFLALPWQDSCLAFHKRVGVVKTASAGQVRQGLYESSVDRWKHYRQHLTPLSHKLSTAIAEFESAGGMWPNAGR